MLKLLAKTFTKWRCETIKFQKALHIIQRGLQQAKWRTTCLNYPHKQGFCSNSSFFSLTLKVNGLSFPASEDTSATSSSILPAVTLFG